METKKQNSVEKVMGDYSEGFKPGSGAGTRKGLTRQQAVTLRLIEAGMRTKTKK